MQSDTQIGITANGTSITGHHEVVDDNPVFYPNFSSWYFGRGEDPGDTAIEDSSSTMTITIVIDGMLEGYYAGLGAEVDTYFPFVSMGGGGSMPEGSTDGVEFTVYRTGSGTEISEPLVVGLDVSGTAKPGVDCDQIPSSVTIDAGQPSKTFSIKPIQDGDIEPNETIVLTVKKNDSAYSWDGAQNNPAAPPPSRTATILDDDILVVLVGGLFQHGGPNGVQPSAGAGVPQIAKKLATDYTNPSLRIHPGNIFMSSSDVDDNGHSGDTTNTGWHKAQERVKNEIDRRVAMGQGRTVKVALVGYSWGGGLIYNVSSLLPAHAQLFFTAYIDAVQLGQNGLIVVNGVPVNAENRRPGSDFHLCYYQSMGVDIHGVKTENLQQDDRWADLDEGAWPFGRISHGEMDHDPWIQQRIVDNIVERKNN